MSVRSVALCLIVAVAGCKHGQYQYRPKPAENSAVEAVAAQFQKLAGAKDDAALLKRVDLTGRMAMLDLLRHSLLRREGLESRSRDFLSLGVLMVRGTEQSGRPFTEPEMKTAMLGALDSLEDRLSGDFAIEPAELKVLAVLLGLPKPPTESERAEAVRAALTSLELKSCETGDPRVSYRADVFREMEEPKSEHWSRWRRGLQSIHLVTLRCADRHGAILLSRHEREPAPRIVAWQFFAPEDWSVIQSRLEKLLAEPG
ncbi:MAG TPA: hypothetical protein VE549_09850 [Myxococcaceae bacterium]|nr:hypothetical protein [Myxococcaceae bacterium]